MTVLFTKTAVVALSWAAAGYASRILEDTHDDEVGES
jgi:hypothetical protein